MEICSQSEMYAADQYTINTLGVPSEMLMENAAQGIVTAFLPYLKKGDNILVFAGRGNNGGDGIAIARRLRLLGFSVKLLLIPKPEELSGAAAFHFSLYQKNGFDIEDLTDSDSLILKADWIVDALFGIGAHGELPPPEQQLIARANESNASILSVDIPSGVSANGAIASTSINADITAMIAYPKQSAYQYPAASHYGKKLVIDIGICKQRNSSHCKTWDSQDFYRTFPKRLSDAHKGSYQKALIVGGSGEMPGAPILAATGCYHAGIGLLQLAIPQTARTAATVRIPEATYLTCEERNGCLISCNIPNEIDLIACGPGLSRNPAVVPLIRSLLQANRPLVLDADALYFLPLFRSEWNHRSSPTILTPHPGEMARLCGISVKEVEQNRFTLSKAMAKEWGCYLVLKGPYTIVTTPDGQQFVNQSGNCGLSKGGSGDLLTGIITAFLGSHQTVQEAVSNAVYLHGAAADRLIQKGRNPHEIAPTELVSTFADLFSQQEEIKSQRPEL